MRAHFELLFLYRSFVFRAAFYRAELYVAFRLVRVYRRIKQGSQHFILFRPVYLVIYPDGLAGRHAHELFYNGLTVAISNFRNGSAAVDKGLYGIRF